MDWIETFTGKKFFVLDPKIEDIVIRDIAHALSLKCRYNGHCKEFYSVAQHCVLVSDYIFNNIENVTDEEKKMYSLWGLLHDAGEAYLPDVPKPIKSGNVGDLKEAEEKIMEKVIEKWKLEPVGEPELVKEVDKRIVKNERVALMNKNLSWDNMGRLVDVEPLEGISIIPWLPEVAEQTFLDKFFFLI